MLIYAINVPVKQFWCDSDYENNPNFGLFLVYDGGMTLSSVNDPMLNINNQMRRSTMCRGCFGERSLLRSHLSR